MKVLEPQLNKKSLLNANGHLGYVFTQPWSLLMHSSNSTNRRAGHVTNSTQLK